MTERKASWSLWGCLIGVIVPLLVALIGQLPWLSDRFGIGAPRPPSSSEKSTPIIKEKPAHVEARTAPKQPVPTAPADEAIVRLTRSNSSRYVEFAQTSVSVGFTKVGGESLATLVVSPRGAESLRKAVLGPGLTFSFSSDAGSFRLSVTGLDLNQQRVDVFLWRR